MSKITLPQITNGQDLSTLNSNFQAIASQLNNNVLYRVNIGSEPNTPAQDLDFNGKKIYNLSDVLVAGISVLTLTQTAEDATGTATAAAITATTQAGIATAAANTAVAVTAGALQKTANLSDLNNTTTARTNLGLGNVTNTSDANKPVSTAQQTALNLKADLTGATFSGFISGPSAARQDATGKYATTFYIQDAITSSSQAAAFTNLFCNGSAGGYALVATNTTAGASIIKLVGNGSSIQNKYLGVNNGSFTIYSSDGSTQILGLGDAGLLTLGKGVNGITGAVAAQAGQIGEVITATGIGPFTMTSGVTSSVGTIALTPGLWMITGSAQFTGSVANINIAYVGSTVTLNTLGGLGDYNQYTFGAPANQYTLAIPTRVIRVSANTTVWISGNINITSGTATMLTAAQATRIA